jgi:phosphatidate phosphatase APP1
MWWILACGEEKLGPAERAARVTELADGRTDDEDEAEIVALLTVVHGEELREVKRLLEPGEENLHHIVFSDLDEEHLRTQLTEHLARSADGLDRPTLRVLSDIDDTVVCTLIDDRYPKGTLYPGVRAFYSELAAEARSDKLPVWLTFVSARPADRTGLVEKVSGADLSRLGFTSFTLLAGTFTGLTSHEAMAETKYSRFLEHRSLWPEEQYVFIGDDGQGDREFGLRMLEHHREAVRFVFIHDVVSAEGDEDRTGEAERALDEAKGLYRFDSYAGAARKAAQLGLLSQAAADRVLEAARTELEVLSLPDEDARSAEIESGQ